MLVRKFTTITWCCFSTWKLPLPPCIEPGITLYCPSFMHFAHPTVHLPKHMHLCSNSSKQWHMLLMCKKNLDTWKKERCMEYLNVSRQCAAGFVQKLSEVVVGLSDFFTQHPSLMDQLPPDLFQGQNLCHIYHTFKTGILQNLFGYILQISQGHTTFLLILWASYFLAKFVSFTQL